MQCHGYWEQTLNCTLNHIAHLSPILLQYLGTHGGHTPLAAAVLISPAWDFMVKSPLFDLWSSMVLVKGLHEYMITNREAFDVTTKVR